MSSGRSARLPPTPGSASTNKSRLASYTLTAEQNSNLLQYSGTGNGGMITNMIPVCDSTESAPISTTSVGVGLGRVGVTNVIEPAAATEIMVEENELSMATTQVLDNLSENERKMIIEVLNRDENVRQRDATRIMLLRAELYSLRRRGTVKIGNTFNGGTPNVTQQILENNQNLPSTHPLLHESNRHCARCNTELGRITNRGAPCRVCKLRVCKTCREFTTRTTDWVCVVCHKQIEIQANTGEWHKECGVPDQGNFRKSIRRSWTISNPEEDTNNPQQPVGDNLYPQQQNLMEAQSAGSYPSLIRHQAPRSRPVNYHTGSAIGISGIGLGSTPQITDYHVNPQRRVLRQSTLPNSLSKNDPNLTGSGANLANYNCVNLTAPTSPHQLQKNPLYPTAYNSEDIIQINTSIEVDTYGMQSQPQLNIPQTQQQTIAESTAKAPTHCRLQIRRQSTLPANPGQAFIYNSTSPNRIYSRSPERSPGEQRYPPFMRQTSFPCNMQEPMSQHHLNVGSNINHTYSSSHRGKLLPQQPQQSGHAFDNSAPVEEMDYAQSVMKPRMTRQATLPNPEQHVKLLPTSPPKRQTSPQYRRSPEFMRQQTLPNPEAFSGNSLSVHPPGVGQAKFMPISPRQKQNFLFPSNPRPFLSQQNVPCVGIAEGGNEEHYSSSQSVNIHHNRDHAKMMKVRSHSNEEYSITKPYPSEGRRLLPEIPTNRSATRSPSRLVRQDCLKDDRSSISGSHDLHARTFGEAKQQFNQFQDVTEEDDTRPEYADYFGDQSSSFLEADEVQYEKSYNAGFCSEPRIIYNDGSDDGSYNQMQRPIVHSAENMLARESTYSYNITGPGQEFPVGVVLGGTGGAMPRTVHMHNRLRRRLSREIQLHQDQEIPPTSDMGTLAREDFRSGGLTGKMDEAVHDRRKPEQMRSVSEDSGAKTNVVKPVTRRSLSHPENDTKTQKKSEPTKIPNPKPLADILDKTRQTKIPAPIRRNSKGSIGADTTEGGTLKSYLNERRNSDLSIKANKNQEQKNNTGTENNETGKDLTNQSNEEMEKTSNVEKHDSTTESDTTKTHTTTLGEQEIQNAVEAAAVVFKKVVLQRRKEKKAAEEDLSNEIETSSEYDMKSLTINHQYYHVNADEFQLVFLNSDSASLRDDEFEDSSSTASSTQNCSSITIDDCDWDYFEPSMLCNTTIKNQQIVSSPVMSPLSRRRCLSHDFKSSDSTASPMESPLLYRKQLIFCPRIRESDTGTDDEILMQGESSSQTSSDNYLTKTSARYQQQMNIKTRIKTRFMGKDNRSSHYRQGNSSKMEEQCKSLGLNSGNVCTCGASMNVKNWGFASPKYEKRHQPHQHPQYVPIPVPVPFPVPMAAFHNWHPNKMVPTPINEDGDLCASIQKLWGTNLSEQSTAVSSNLHAAAAAAVVAAYSNAASLDACGMPQNCAAKMSQTEKSDKSVATTTTTTNVMEPVFNVGLRSVASVDLASAGMNQSLCSSSGYETTTTGGSLERLHCNQTDKTNNPTPSHPTSGYNGSDLSQLQQNVHNYQAITADYRTGIDSIEVHTEPPMNSNNKYTHKKPTTTTTAESADTNSNSHHHQYRRLQKQQQQRHAEQLNQQLYVSAANVKSGFLNVESSVSGTPKLVPLKPSASLSRDCIQAEYCRSQEQQKRGTNGNETTPTLLDGIDQQAHSQNSITLVGAHNELNNTRKFDNVFHKNNNVIEADTVANTLPPTVECQLSRYETANASSEERPLLHSNRVDSNKKYVCDRSTTQTTSLKTSANICASNINLKAQTSTANSSTATTGFPLPANNTQTQHTDLETTEQQLKSPRHTDKVISEFEVRPMNKQRLSNIRSIASTEGKEKIATPESKVQILYSTTKSIHLPEAGTTAIVQCSCTCTTAAQPIPLEIEGKQTENIESINSDIEKVLVKVDDNDSTSVQCELASSKDVKGRLFSPQDIKHAPRRSMITIGKLEKPSAEGFLQSENVFVSSECSASDSENESVSGISACDEDIDQVPICSSVLSNVQDDEMQKKYTNYRGRRSRREPIQRTYEFGAVALRDELISNSKDSDNNTGSTSDSSISISSSESVDSDDTGTIADRKPKKRNFSKVFVVNRNASRHRRNHVGSSTENDSLSSDANLEDSSDNDTDTERTDCGIVLNYVKIIGEENVAQVHQQEDTLRPNENKSEIDNNESECDDDDDDVDCYIHKKEGGDIERRMGTADEEIANCIIVVGGITDDVNGAVVLNSMRMLGDDELNTLPSDHGIVNKNMPNAISSHRKRKSIIKKHTKESEQLESARNINASIVSLTDVELSDLKTIDTAVACEELHSIANDVNRLLGLSKQNSGLELKLQKLRRDVNEINEDHLPKTTNLRSDSPIYKVDCGISQSSEAQMSGIVNALTTANATMDPVLQTGMQAVLCAESENQTATALGGGDRGEVNAKEMHNEFANKTIPYEHEHHKEPSEEISNVNILASEHTNEHETSMVLTEVGCDGRGDIGGGTGAGVSDVGGDGGRGGVMELANEQVFGGDKIYVVDSQNSSNSNDARHRTKRSLQQKTIYNVLNDDHNADENSEDWEERTRNKNYDKRENNNKIKRYTTYRPFESDLVESCNNKTGNENITEITHKQYDETAEEEENEQHQKQVNTEIYTHLATTSGHEQHTNNEFDAMENKVKHPEEREFQTKTQQRENREEQNQLFNEPCKTKKPMAEYFMDLERTQTEITTTTKTLEIGELTESEQYRKTPESKRKQVVSKVNGNVKSNNNNTNSSELKSVRVVVVETLSSNNKNPNNSYVCNTLVGNRQAVCAETETVVNGLAKLERAVKNEMLNAKDESQLSVDFRVEIAAVAVDDVNGNNSGSVNASVQNLREQITTGERNTDTKTFAIEKQESITSVNMLESLNNDEKWKISNKNNNDNNFQMSSMSIDDFPEKENNNDDDDKNEISNYQNNTNLDIREIESDNSARMLDAYYAPFYSDISSSGTPKKINSPNSLSAKYRSLTMITKDTIKGNGNAFTATTTNPTPKLLPNTAIVNTSRVLNNESVYVFESENASDIGDQSNVTNLNNKLQTHMNKSNDPNLPAIPIVSTNVNDLREIIGNTRHDDSLEKLSTYSDIKTAVSSKTETDPRECTKVDEHCQLETVDLLRDQKICDYDADHSDEVNAENDRSESCKNKLPVICLEDGLADDDSWVEEISQNEEDVEDITTPTASDSEDMSVDDDDVNSINGMFVDREEELRGYHRSAIDFTLHTIVEESCEESEVASMRYTEDEDLDEMERSRQRTLNHHNRLSASDLEKYFFFGLGDGKVMSSIDTRGDDTASEVSSECSEEMDSLGIPEESANQVNSAAELASSRLEKYFLSGFMGFNGNEKDECDESGSVGSDSEGHPSPSQRRKRLVRARGTPRSHNSSLDNLLVDTQITGNDSLEVTPCEMGDSSESDVCDETVFHVDKGVDSNASDTIKRKKQVRKRHDSLDDKKLPDSNDECNKLTTSTSECRTPIPGSISIQTQAKKQQHHSRDSGFVGSNDDLLKTSESELQVVNQVTNTKSPSVLEQIDEFSEIPSTSRKKTIVIAGARTISSTTGLQPDGVNKKPPLPPNSNSTLVRKDSFNNWSSDEETNLMMSKMRQFFKTLVVATANAHQNYNGSNSNSKGPSPNQTTPISVRRMKSRPPQLAYFENELTRLMKTVPGINDEQVRELVEYLSSEDTWSDSYDSSDYNSSDLEGSNRKKCELKEQISASCQRIINKFEVDEEGDRGDGGLLDETNALNLDTALVYQKLVASFSKIAGGNSNNSSEINNIPAPKDEPSDSNLPDKPMEEDTISTSSNLSTERSPQLFAKVMQHIGTRLVALMHEVNSGNDSHGTNSPQPTQRQSHKRLQAKISITTTEDEEESQSESPQVKSTRSYPLGVGIGTHNHAYPHNHHTQAQQKVNKQLDDAKKLARSKSHDLLLDVASSTTGGGIGISINANTSQPNHHQSSSGVSDTAGEECGVASDYERFSWRGSFESALLANGDSRTKLCQLDRDNLSSASALAIAKRRSAGDLLFNHKSLSREQLDRVRSCGSIGGGDERHHELEASPAKPWVSSTDSRDVRRSSVPDAIYESDSSEENAFGARSTLPRVLTGGTQVASTNSLPRLSTSCMGSTSTPNQMTKSQGALNFVPSVGSAKSARYRSPGLSGRTNNSLSSNKCSSSLGLQNFLYSKRDTRKRLNMSSEEAKAAAEELNRSPVIGQQRNDPTSSPIHSRGSASSDAWPVQSDEDIDRLVAMHQNRSSFSSLGIRSDSMASVYSGAGEGRYGTVVVKGKVEFGMQYNYKLSCLEIHVVRCKDLAAVDVKRNRSDPYVKVYLLPDKSKSGKRKTKVKKHTLNPIFDEVLRFQMPISSLESRTLWLSVWHSDMFGRNDFLGEVTVNLQGKVFDNPQSQWYALQERSEPFDEIASYRGDIVVGLKFIPPENSKGSFSRGSFATGGSSNLRKFGSIKSVTKSDRSSKGGQLHVLVKEAKHLSPIKANGSCDAFCKSYLLPDRTRSSKQKTPVVKRSLHPSWNYTFVYEDVSLEDLSERALELTVWDHDRLASNEFIGGVRFSLGTGKSYGRLVDWMDASGKELSLWQNMLNRPNFWVEGSLILKSTLDGVRPMT